MDEIVLSIAVFCLQVSEFLLLIQGESFWSKAHIEDILKFGSCIVDFGFLFGTLRLFTEWNCTFRVTFPIFNLLPE